MKKRDEEVDLLFSYLDEKITKLEERISSLEYGLEILRDDQILVKRKASTA